MQKPGTGIVAFDAGTIQRKIYTIRDQQVMLDVDLAEFYGVETIRLNEQVKRNRDRFPVEFMFQLTKPEFENLMSQIAISSLRHGGHRKLPYAFTEQGVAILAGVLRSDTAVKMSIQIINAFVGMRKFILHNAQLFQRIDNVERRQVKLEMETDAKLERVFNAIQSRDLEPKQGIFFNGQIFDAYKFVSGLIRNAEKHSILIDNYIDETVPGLFSKKKKGVRVTIYTKKITKEMKLDIPGSMSRGERRSPQTEWRSRQIERRWPQMQFPVNLNKVKLV